MKVILNQQSKDKLQAVKDKLDELRGAAGQCLADTQNILNAVTDDDTKDDLQEIADLLEELDDKFSSLDNSIEEILE